MTDQAARTRPAIVGRKPDGDGRLRRAILHAARADALLQDEIDAADLAWSVDEQAVAKALYGLVALRLGATPRMFDILRDAAGRIGWPVPMARDHAPAAAGFSIDAAIGELRALIALEPTLPAGWEEARPPSPATATEESTIAASADLLHLADQAAALLALVPDALARGDLHALLTPHFTTLAGLEPIRIEAHLGLDTPALAQLFALEQVRGFLVRSWHLFAVKSEPPLLNVAAGLDPGVLGPYFVNVQMLLRDSADFLGLIEAAMDGQEGNVELWALLLSAWLKPQALVDVAVRLGDRGYTHALRGILARIGRAADLRRFFDAIQAIRDAGLDLGDLPFAVEAQDLLARARRTDSNEWAILGMIQAAAGDTVHAEASLERATFLQPDNEDARIKLALLKAGQEFSIERGITSTATTQRIRSAQLKARQQRGEGRL